MSGFNALQAAAYDDAARQRQRQQFQGMSAYDRHKKMVRDLATYYGKRLGQEGEGAAAGGAPVKTDYEIMKDVYRFIRTEADDAADSWEVRLARRYYSKLFREFAIADLSRHEAGRVGLRWRSQEEVVAGKGQFICGAVGCEERRGLASFEVPFSYSEAGERKSALVKVRVCPTHAYQLNYKKNKEAEEAYKRRERRKGKKRRRRRRGSGSSESGDSSCSSSSGNDSEDLEGKGKEGAAEHRHPKRSRGSGPDAAGAKAQAEEEPAAAAAGRVEQRGGQGAAAAAAQRGKGGEARADQEFDEFFKGLFE